MKYIIVTIFSLLISVSAVGQDAKYKALFIYKFLQNIEWPANKSTDKYVVGVMGDDDVLDQVKSLTSGRTINGKPIEVFDYSSGSMSNINLLFLGDRNNAQFESINSDAISNSVVLVTESPGFAKKGSGINFVTNGDKLKFEMNLSSLERANVIVSGSIKSLAVLVN